MATGTITLDGVKRPWASPIIADIEEFEVTCGPLTDLDLVNSVRGRVYLAWLCLRAADPKVKIEDVKTLPTDDYLLLWPMITQAIPLWKELPRPPAPTMGREDGSPPSSDSAETDSAGPQASPESSG